MIIIAVSLVKKKFSFHCTVLMSTQKCKVDVFIFMQFIVRIFLVENFFRFYSVDCGPKHGKRALSYFSNFFG